MKFFIFITTLLLTNQVLLASQQYSKPKPKSFLISNEKSNLDTNKDYNNIRNFMNDNNFTKGRFGIITKDKNEKSKWTNNFKLITNMEDILLNESTANGIALEFFVVKIFEKDKIKILKCKKNSKKKINKKYQYKCQLIKRKGL